MLDPTCLKVVACGDGKRTLDMFSRGFKAPPDEFSLLLLDSEGPVAAGTKAWAHIENRGEKWERPEGAKDEQAHLMVQMMEAWFLADKEKLDQYYGRGFRRKALPQSADVEKVDKTAITDGLSRATKDTQKGRYRKVEHGFEILPLIDPESLCKKGTSRHAARLVDLLREVSDSS